jgi:hypothetical protein
MSTLRAVELIQTAAASIPNVNFITGTRLLNNIEADDIGLPVCILDRPIRIPQTIEAGGLLKERFSCTVFFFDKSELEYQFEQHEPIIGAMKLVSDQFLINLDSFSDYIESVESIEVTDLINALDSNLTGVQVSFSLSLFPLDEQVCPTGSFTPSDLPNFYRYLTDAPIDGNQYARQDGEWVVVTGGGGGSALRVQDEGTTVTNAATTINFTGAGVTASLASPGNVTVNIPAASGGTVNSVNGQTGTVVLDTDDVSDTATNRYTNDTDITRLANTSGTNTGDQDLSGLALKATTISTQSPLSGGGDLSANRTLSIPQANGSTDGYLSSADWNAFNSKGNGTVESVNSGINISVDNTDPDNPVINSLADRYKTTSATSNSVSNGSKSFTVDLNLSYIPLQEILIVHNPANHMHGEVTSYNPATGALVVDIKNHTGSGTYTSWVLNLDGTPVDALTGSGTANEIAYFTAARVLSSLPVATYPSLTELSYVKGVTSSIQTQLNGKQNISGVRYRSTTNQTAVTGNTNNNQVISFLVPANTIPVGAIGTVKPRIGKTGGAGITTFRLYANTADSITSPAPTLLMTIATSSIGNTYLGGFRDIAVKSSTVTQTAQANASIPTDAAVGVASLTNSNIDWTVDQYLIVSIQNGANGDSTVLSFIDIEFTW